MTISQTGPTEKGYCLIILLRQIVLKQQGEIYPS